MRDDFSEKLNREIDEAYRLITEVEEAMLHSSKRLNVSIREVHLLEKVADSGQMRISELAAAEGITTSSTTTAVNKLARKGFVEKRRDERDGRIVYVSLTKEGRFIDKLHRRFHRSMTYDVSQGLTEEEKEALLKGLERLNGFLKNRAERQNRLGKRDKT